MRVPQHLVTVPKYRFPETWIQFGLDQTDLSSACEQLVDKTEPSTLQAWGQRVEEVVDVALRRESAKRPELELPCSLPKRCRGRCQPVKLTRRPILPLAKNPRQGSYHPKDEPISFRSRKLFTQYRRVESLCNRLKRVSDFAAFPDKVKKQLREEWEAICRHRILGFSFFDWCQQVPELGPCPAAFPPAAWLEDLKQYLRYHVDSQASLDAKHREDILAMRHRIDVKEGHSKQAFSMIRGPGKPCFSTTVQELEELAIPALEPGALRLYLDHASRFVTHAPVFVNHHPSQLLSHDDHSILVRPLTQLDVTHVDQQDLNLCTSSIWDLTAQVKAEWEQHLLLMNTERKDIGYMLPIDAAGTARVLSRFTGAERLTLLREVCGSFHTFEQKSRWDTEVTGCCPWCPDQTDNRIHRIFECSAFSTLRGKFGTLLEELHEDRPWLGALPTLRVAGPSYFVQQLLNSFPEPCLQSSMQTQIQGLYGDATPRFFTDGSCAFPDLAMARFASYGVIVDLAVTDDVRRLAADRFCATDHMPDTLVPLAAARVQGRQCIHRAEMLAVLWVYQHFSHAEVFTDSQDTHDWVSTLQHDRAFPVDPLHPDFDLLTRMRSTLQPGHQIRKVKAHQDCHAISNLLDCYSALGNKAADHLAGETNRNLFPEAANELWTYANQYRADVEQLHEFYTYLLQLAEARKHAPSPSEPAAGSSESQPMNLSQQLRTYTACGDWTCPDTFCQDWLSFSIWGVQICSAIHAWLLECKWPSSPAETPGPDALGISWVEITLAVVMKFGMWLPVLRKRADGQEYVVQPCTHTEAQQIGTCMGEQTWIMSQIFTHLQSLVPEKLLPEMTKGKVLSLTALGFNLRLGGWLLRPSFPDQGLVIDALQQYAPTATPVSGFSNKVSAQLGGLPEGVVKSDFALWPEDVETFTRSHAELKRAASGAQTSVLRRRKARS
eukprot:Skav231660  [mRNA]  locus=scaffold823:176737:181197:- [translate_table: standard]